MKQNAQWNRLDNAAKIFPPTSNVMDTKVFRCSCEFYEEIDPKLLQSALNETIVAIPYFRSVIKRGFFWYYLEESRLMPLVKKEYKPPCSTIYQLDRKSLLFEVNYHKNRMNLEVYHALTDGTGALQFFQCIVIRYLQKRYEKELPDNLLSEMEFLESQVVQDSFSKYYSKVRVKKSNSPSSFQLRGERLPDYRYGLVECIMPMGEVKALAKRYDVTMTELFTAYLLEAIHEGMSRTQERLPVTISVPVNLRNYFPSNSMRNFFGVILVSHHFQKEGSQFSDILSHVKEQFQTQLNPEAINQRMNLLTSVEKKAAAKVIPLVLKSPALKISNSVFDRSFTAGLSNVGEVKMPEPVQKYIRLFDVFSSSKKLNLCLCSYLDHFLLSFTTSFASMDIQRAMVRRLASEGIHVTVDSNLDPAGQEDAP